MGRITNPVDLFARNPSDQAVRLEADQFNQIIVIDSEHARIHQGVSFFAGYLWGEIASPTELVADNASVEILIQASSGMHAIFDVSAGGDADIQYFENPTFSAAGTSLTTFNKNRYSANTSLATITHTPTITADGTAFPAKFLPGGTGGNSSGGEGGGFNREIDLKGGNDYLIRVTNRKGQPSPISIIIEWYEPS